MSKFAIPFVFSFLLLSTSLSAAELHGVAFQSEPWGYIKQEQNRGIICDFYQRLEQHVGHLINCEVYPFYRVLQSLKSGSGDFSILYRTENTSSIAEPLIKLTQLDNIVVPQKRIRINHYDDLADLTIATLTKNKFGPPFDRDEQLQKVKVTNYSQAVKMLKMGRVDAVIGSKASLEYNLKLQGLSLGQFGNPWVLNSKEVWFYLSKQSTFREHELLLTALRKLSANNVYEEIIKQAIDIQTPH